MLLCGGGGRSRGHARVEIGGERASSTAVREALRTGDLDRASHLLGRTYAMAGHVAHGAKLGRTLGFPTINLPLKRCKIE